MTNNIFRFVSSDRNYTTWKFISIIDNKEKELKDLSPKKATLFNNDVFTYNENTCEFQICESETRTTKNISGVLILQGNKTFGRHKNGKLLYKCYPDDMRLPSFLIPYEMKNIGFSKVFTNQYITFNVVDWTDKHPYGSISQRIGSVDKLEHFYEYQLYCKSLNSSIQQFTRDTNAGLSKDYEELISRICDKQKTIEDRESWHVFSIDPVNSLDFDDAFSIRPVDNGNILLSIYISNVSLLLDELNVWDSFSRRISTIYLPDKKRPMLPTILSDCLCSLQSDKVRLAFVMDCVIDPESDIVDITYANCKIKVFKNYRYEEPSLLASENYQLLFNKIKKIPDSNIKNSHDLVSYLMILMNNKTALKMMEYKNGIFRSTILKNDTKKVEPSDSLPNKVVDFIKIWNNTSGNYINLENIKVNESIKHELMGMDAYIHITSPIRRLVDLLNMIQFQNNIGLPILSQSAYTFYQKWIDEMDYINSTMRSIKKVQNECSLLDLCSTNSDIMDLYYDGFIIDKIIRHDEQFQYTIYLPEIGMVSRIIVGDELTIYQKNKYKLYLFHNEEKFKKKIRLQLMRPK
jgi:exoribonuclease R